MGINSSAEHSHLRNAFINPVIVREARFSVKGHFVLTEVIGLTSPFLHQTRLSRSIGSLADLQGFATSATFIGKLLTLHDSKKVYVTGIDCRWNIANASCFGTKAVGLIKRALSLRSVNESFVSSRNFPVTLFKSSRPGQLRSFRCSCRSYNNFTVTICPQRVHKALPIRCLVSASEVIVIFANDVRQITTVRDRWRNQAR